MQTYKKLWRACVMNAWSIFTSLRLTFVTLAFLGAGAIIGMSYNQNVNFEEFFRNRPLSASRTLLEFFEIYDAFHSWWFSLAILLLAANLIACSIERLPRIFFDHIYPRPYLTKRRLNGLSLKAKRTARSLSEAQEVVAAFMPNGLKSRLASIEECYFYERDRWAKFGVYVVHIALLIIMFSSVFATQYGVDAHVQVDEGKKVRFVIARGPSGINYSYDLGFYIGCDDFRLRTFIDDSPMEFESDLFVSRDGKDRFLQKTVRVNEPLNYAGFTFYQSSYQPLISEKTVTIDIADHKGFLERRSVRLGSQITLPNNEILTVEKFYDDFAGLGQALRIAKKSIDGESTFFHIFRRYSEFDSVIRNDDYHITFIEPDQQYATGLSVSKMPGISIIFFGFLLLMAGLYMCFFMTPIRYFARIIDRRDCYYVWLAAAGFRNSALTKHVFMARADRGKGCAHV